MKTSMEATKPIGTAELAAILGWTTERTRDWLDRLAEKDPSIVTRVNGRRMTTLSSLRRVMPDIAKHMASADDVDDIRDDQAEQKRELDELAKAFSEFRAKSWEWFQRIRVLEEKISSLGQRG